MMKVVILAGGLGTRISEESYFKPKPMIEIGDRPILWHIIKIFESQGFGDFIICLGYKSHMIKDYFLNYYHYCSDLTVDLADNSVEVHQTGQEKFKITLVETGLNTGTAGRLKRVMPFLEDQKDFFLTYGDGVADVDLKKLLKFHRDHGRIATVTTVQPEGRFGLLGLDEANQVNDFQEKPKGDVGWINGGFFVFKHEVFDYLPLDADKKMLEEVPLFNLSQNGQLMAHKHRGFWRCMDAIRDKQILEELWNSGKAAWKIWE